MGWILIIALAVAAYFIFKDKKTIFSQKSEAEKTLDLKYASGEITEDEYLRKKEMLKK